MEERSRGEKGEGSHGGKGMKREGKGQHGGKRGVCPYPLCDVSWCVPLG